MQRYILGAGGVPAVIRVTWDIVSGRIRKVLYKNIISPVPRRGRVPHYARAHKSKEPLIENEFIVKPNTETSTAYDI
jgi:hypothetical protein